MIDQLSSHFARSLDGVWTAYSLLMDYRSVGV
jgi:hypothetical protein